MYIAIIGSGPSAFYAAQALSNNDNNKVDIIEKLFAPYGLVRYGVAPDHQKTKNIIKLFNRVLEKENVNFFGNIDITEGISLNFISDTYDAVILATGASKDKMLNIKGENIPGVYGSSQIVGWYNDDPKHVSLSPDLNTENVVIIGNGNVALDCARILAKDQKELEGSDISSSTLKRLSSSKIKNIYIFGRRGPKEAKFTISELREFKELENFSIKVNFSRELIETYINDDSIDTRIKKNLEIFNEFYDIKNKNKNIIFDFFKSPVEIIGDQFNKKIKIINSNKDTTIINTNLIIKAIGYRSSSINNLKMDESNNFLLSNNGYIEKNIYATGWAANNSVGVIGTNKARSLDVVKKIESEIVSSKNNSTDKLIEELKRKNINFISKKDWESLDHLEEKNAMSNFIREKFRTTDEALKALKQT
ncbi:MAG: NADPH-ferredoxin reductase FprA [Alphaproteobacteria bacterium MarineAlpha9_Bin4]|nr:MAG: NADPH-ferredoxin reductase FprA [Alphaproteobacteria bacterium MarineAlpha9_Bin4]